MDSHSLLQGIFLTQGLNPCLFCLLSWQVGSLPLGPQIGAISFYPMRVCSVVQSRLILCNPMDYSPPGSSVHGISQARIQNGLTSELSKGQRYSVGGGLHFLLAEDPSAWH